jgi:hypothetical protein
MRTVNGLWIFYKKLICPSLALSLCFGVLMGTTSEFIGMTGFAYILVAPFFHLMIYDLTGSGEYYFYYNLGLSKLALWVNTAVTSLIIGLLLVAI